MTSPGKNFFDNIQDVNNLLKIYYSKKSIACFERSWLRTLNKSIIVFVTATWEAYVEDTISCALDFMVNMTDDHTLIPKDIRKKISLWYSYEKNEMKFWDMAGDGWKHVMKEYKKHKLSSFNTPTTNHIDKIYEETLGIKSLSNDWKWKRMTSIKAREKLDYFIDLRCKIAHCIGTEKNITNLLISDYINFIFKICEITDNRIRDYIYKNFGTYPWESFSASLLL
ncbi:MAG: HEPN domain-containing protein [bacterium]